MCRKLEVCNKTGLIVESLSPVGRRKEWCVAARHRIGPPSRLSLLTYNQNERHLATLSRALDPRCLAYVPKGQHTMVAAGLRQAFQQLDHAAARIAFALKPAVDFRFPSLSFFLSPSPSSLQRPKMVDGIVRIPL
jgi:hypothetical protein